MSQIKGKLKQRARILKGRTAANHSAEVISKMLELPFAATPDELEQAFAHAKRRRLTEKAEIDAAYKNGEVIKMED